VANLIKVICYLVENSLSDLQDRSKGKNRVNDMGDSLEAFITDIFADTLGEKDESIRVKRYSEVFSYLGNPKTPPDFIVRDGDAIEVKKIESFKAEIALNSSYPKSKLSADDPMITKDCRIVDGGNWQAKDLIYVIGVVKENKLKRLWLIVGDCLAADEQIYKQIRDEIIIGIKKIRDIELSKNRELGRFKKIDPLGIAYSQIIGAWRISNPVNIYDYLNIDYNEEANLQVIAIMTAKKYRSFPQSDLDTISKIATEVNNLKIRDVQINSPNNPADLIDAKLITYQN
jgi:NgoPII restriction endonuclease